MTEALTIEPGSWLRTPAPPPSREARHRRRSANLVPVPALPVMQPGQLWFAGLPAVEPELLPLEYRALTTANVVIYDPAVAPIVARFLPLGGYAEPAASGREAFNPTSERCLRFVRDGWSVARLVDPDVLSSGERVDELRCLSELLLSRNISVDLRVIILANIRGAYEKFETSLAELGTIIDPHYFQRSPNLTIVYDSIGSEPPAQLSVIAGNGLAG